jgi:hypothetical protein
MLPKKIVVILNILLLQLTYAAEEGESKEPALRRQYSAEDQLSEKLSSSLHLSGYNRDRLHSFLRYLHDTGKTYNAISKGSPLSYSTIYRLTTNSGYAPYQDYHHLWSFLKKNYQEDFEAWKKTTTAYEAADTKLIYKSLSIVDDTMAKVMKQPGVFCVHHLLDKISEKPDHENCEVLDVSENNIGIEGANMIIKYIILNLPNLKALNLACNMISDWKDTLTYREFNKDLIEILRRKDFKTLDIRGNKIATHGWFQGLLSSLKEDKEVAQKINWE